VKNRLLDAAIRQCRIRATRNTHDVLKYLIRVKINQPDVVGQNETFFIHEKTRRNANYVRRRDHEQLQQTATRYRTFYKLSNS